MRKLGATHPRLQTLPLQTPPCAASRARPPGRYGSPTGRRGPACAFGRRGRRWWRPGRTSGIWTRPAGASGCGRYPPARARAHSPLHPLLPLPLTYTHATIHPPTHTHIHTQRATHTHDTTHTFTHKPHTQPHTHYGSHTHAHRSMPQKAPGPAAGARAAGADHPRPLLHRAPGHPLRLRAAQRRRRRPLRGAPPVVLPRSDINGSVHFGICLSPTHDMPASTRCVGPAPRFVRGTRVDLGRGRRQVRYLGSVIDGVLDRQRALVVPLNTTGDGSCMLHAISRAVRQPLKNPRPWILVRGLDRSTHLGTMGVSCGGPADPGLRGWVPRAGVGRGAVLGPAARQGALHRAGPDTTRVDLSGPLSRKRFAVSRQVL